MTEDLGQDPLEQAEAIAVAASLGRKTPSRFYPDKLSVDQNCGFLNKSQLRKRGWTDKNIATHLGEPDRTAPVPVYRNGRWRAPRKDRPACQYAVARVLAVEKTFGGEPPPRERNLIAKDASPVGRFTTRLQARLEDEEYGALGNDPPTEEELELLEQVALEVFDIPDPWKVDRGEYVDDTLLLHLGHRSPCRWKCPRCARVCGVYGHMAERVWIQAWLPIRTTESGVVRINVAVLGRVPRVKCPQHGVKQIAKDRAALQVVAVIEPKPKFSAWAALLR